MATDADIQLSDLLESYPSSLSPNILELLSNKKEFAELASDANEKLEPGSFKFFKHQEFVHRFMRNYDDLMDISETGTGKSGSTIGFLEKCRIEFEKLKKAPASADKKLAHFKRFVILVNGPTQKAEFRKQLLKTAADEFFEEPVNIKKDLSSEQIAKAEKTNISRRIKKAGYIIKTYGKFAREIRGDKIEKEGDQTAVKKKGMPSYPIYNIDKNILTDEEIAVRKRQNDESTRRLIEDYSDSIFWIDEAHNLNMEPDKFGSYKEKIETYRTIWWVFHTVLRSKRIISTATPMLNRDIEVIFLLNLLLPKDDILPIGYDYINAPPQDIETFFPGFPLNRLTRTSPEEIGKYFRGQIYVRLPKEIRETHRDIGGTRNDGNGKERIPIDMENITFDEIEPYLRGRVFYIRAGDTGATPVEQGITTVVEAEYNGKTYTSVITTENSYMSDYQNDGYEQVTFKSEVNGKNKDDIYTAARQMANFRFPPVSVASSSNSFPPRDIVGLTTEEIQILSEEKENVENIDEEHLGSFRTFIKAKGDRFIVNEGFQNDLIINTQKYGCKYARSIEITDTTPGFGYTYGTYVEGAGAIVLAACYQARGYERFNESSSVFGPKGINIKPAKRIGLITGTISDSRLNAMLELAASYENRYGDYIKELLLSRTARDGINIPNAVRIQLINSEWNESGNYQALSRGIRATSHEGLLKEYQDIIDDLTDITDKTLMDKNSPSVNKAFDIISALSGGLKTEWNGTVTNYNIFRFVQYLLLAKEMSIYNDMLPKVEKILKRADKDIGEDLIKRTDWVIENLDITTEQYYLLVDFKIQRRLRVNADKLEQILTDNLSRSLPNGAEGKQLEEFIEFIPNRQLPVQEQIINNINAINTIFFEKSSLYKNAIPEWLADNDIIESIRVLLENSIRLIKDMTTRSLTKDLAKEYQDIKKELLKKVKDDYVKTVPPTAALEIKIYKHAAIPLGEDDGVDIMMYRKVEEKSHHIKRIMEFLRRASIGYEVFKNRNIRPLDEIQYEGPEINPETLDYSTYDIVYSKPIIADIMREIGDIFRDHMSLTFTELLNLLPKYQIDYIIDKLSNVQEINQLIPIYQNDYILNAIKNANKNKPSSSYEDNYLSSVLKKLRDYNLNEITQYQIEKLFPIHRNRALLAVIKGLKDLRDLRDRRKILDLLPPYREKYVVMALEDLVTNKIPLLDKFGHTVYLRENDGYFYLTRTYPIGRDSTYSMLYYTENIIAVKNNTISDITDVQSINLGNEVLIEIAEKYPTDQIKIIEYLDTIPIEAQERVLEDVIIAALIEDKNYFLVPVKLNKKKNYIDFIIEKYRDFIIRMNEPLDDITELFKEQANPKTGPGRKRDLTKVAKDKRYHTEDFNEIAEKMKQNEENEIVYLHTLNSKASGRAVYNVTAKIIKGEGRVPILKISEIQKGWRNLEGVEKDAYRPYIQKIMNDRQNNFINTITDFDEYQIYGTMIGEQFRIVDKGKETGKGKNGKLSSQSRGLACGAPSGKTIPKPYLIDVLLRIKAPLPVSTILKPVTDANREEIIDKLINGTGHSTLKNPGNKPITDRTVVEAWSNEKLTHYYFWIYTGRTTQQMADAVFARLDEMGAIKYE